MDQAVQSPQTQTEVVEVPAAEVVELSLGSMERIAGGFIVAFLL